MSHEEPEDWGHGDDCDECREARQIAAARQGIKHLGAVVDTSFAELLSLLDRARNWVQDPVLRAEITRIIPPKPRTPDCET